MKRRNIIIGLVVSMVISTASLFSQNWPQFRGPGRDSRITGFKAPAEWPKELTQIWKVKVGTGDATPVLSGKFMYLNTRQDTMEVILCIDAEAGTLVWADKYPAVPVKGAAASHPGPRSTPAIAGGKVVTFGASGILSCLDAATGKVLWRKDNPNTVVPQFFTGMSPLIADGTVMVHIGTKDNGSFLALDLKTGNEKWKWSGDGPAYASPSIMAFGNKKHIILQTEKNLMALDFATGTVLWQIPTPVQQRFYNCVSPYIDANKIYYTGQGTGTKAIQVTKQGKNFVTKELWSNTETGAKWNTPVLKNGFLYGFTDKRNIYCLNTSSGKTAWIDQTTNSDFATIVDCGSVIIGFPSTGNLIVFKPDPNAYTEIAKYKVAETPVYSFPVVAGNLVYVKDAEHLTLYKIQ